MFSERNGVDLDDPVHGLDPGLLDRPHERARRLRPQAREAHELDDSRGDELDSLRESLDLPVLDDLDDLLLDRPADPAEVLRLAGQGELGDGAPRLADAGRSAAIGEHPERGLAFELEQVGEQVELLGDVLVLGQCLRHAS